MKKIVLSIAALIALALPLAAHAHVLLSTPYTVTGPLGVVTCSASHVTATHWEPTVNAGTVTGVTVTYSFGTATFSAGTDNGWTTASCAPTYVFQLDFTSGTWTLAMVSGCIQVQVAQGTMAGVTLTTAQSNYQNASTKAFNNDADQFLVTTGAGLLQQALGTQPDTW